jgi:HAD superfamily hydrolase (TIGR01549 family)
MKIAHPSQLPGIVRSRKISLLSVDLFDTLVYRECSQPDRVFARQFVKIRGLLACVSAQNEWIKLRKSAEREVSENSHPQEVHLDEIYRCIADRLGLSAEFAAAVKQAELDAEFSLIKPFEELLEVLKELQLGGIKILINTDIYLPVGFIRSIVDQFCEFETELMCSSETRRPKRTGAAFDLLLERFPGKSILHIGDNLYSDYKMAQRHGVSACLIEWDRSRWIRKNLQWTRYVDELGACRLSNVGRVGMDSPFQSACNLLAWRWASVLFDFLLCLRNYASRISADEIWFLSRDCESLYHAIRCTDGFLKKFKTKYVHTSRAATYPIFAASQPKRFETLTQREPNDDDITQAEDLATAYRQSVSETTRRILIVDAGWKGRVQTALKLALPDIEVYGFYFSLDPLAEQEARDASHCFVPWRPAHINQAAVECLFGFREASCIGYRQDDAGNWRPQFRDRNNDTAPREYCDGLRHYLSALIADAGEEAVEAPMQQRLAAIQRVCMYPDHSTALAFQEWAIGAAVDGGDATTVIQGGKSDRLSRMLGIQRDGNIWPAVAIWGLSPIPSFVRALQAGIHARKALTFAFKGPLPQSR